MDNEITKTILDSYNYLKTVTDSRFIYSGSYGLYINNIILPRKFHDLDIRFIDLSREETKKLNLEFIPRIDKLLKIKLDLQYKEVNFNGVELLVYTPESIIACKKRTLDFICNKAHIITDKRLAQKEKILKDLDYLKSEYNLE